MLFPLISVSLIGLFAGLAAITRSGPRASLTRCLLAAWIGYIVGAILGIAVEALLIGGFWIGLAGHVGAFLSASRTSQVSAPAARRSIST